MVTLNIHSPEIGAYLAILLRMSLILFLIPVFSSTEVPRNVKILTVMALSVMLYPLLHKEVTPLPFDLASLLRVTTGEIIFGIITAMSVLFIFVAFQLAGELISFEMGFGFAQAVDPQSGTQVTIISQWFQLIATLLFFAVNGHHFVLKAIVESFRVIPIGGFVLDTVTFDKIIFLAGQMFVVGIKMAAPVMIVLFLTQVGFGLVAKFAPEVNILIVSLPVTIVMGLIFLGLSIPVWGNAMQYWFANLFQFLQALMS